MVVVDLTYLHVARRYWPQRRLMTSDVGAGHIIIQLWVSKSACRFFRNAIGSSDWHFHRRRKASLSFSSLATSATRSDLAIGILTAGDRHHYHSLLVTQYDGTINKYISFFNPHPDGKLRADTK